jgi:hypothetical protein
VFSVVDNGASHAGQRSIERMQRAWPTAHLIHLPIHASWLNQAELLFSIVQRKALTPNDFGSLDDLAERLLTLGERYREIAQPFQWTFTRHELDRVLAKIATASHTYGSRPNDQNQREGARASAASVAELTVAMTASLDWDRACRDERIDAEKNLFALARFASYDVMCRSARPRRELRQDADVDGIPRQPALVEEAPERLQVAGVGLDRVRRALDMRQPRQELIDDGDRPKVRADQRPRLDAQARQHDPPRLKARPAVVDVADVHDTPNVIAAPDGSCATSLTS